MYIYMSYYSNGVLITLFCVTVSHDHKSILLPEGRRRYTGANTMEPECKD
jgi:hypothetical protein